jgi:hypothetical protein
VCRRLAFIGLRQHLVQQRFGGETHQSTHFNGGAVPLAWNFLHQMLDQHFDDVGRAFGCEDFAALRIKALLCEQVGHNGERQRVAKGEVENGSVLFFGHVALTQVSLTFFAAEVTQRQRAQQALPSAIELPGAAWRVAPASTTRTRSGKLRQKLLAQPVIERSQQLVGVDEKTERPSCSAKNCVADSWEKARKPSPEYSESLGRRVDVAAIKHHRMDVVRSHTVANSRSSVVLPTPPRPNT